MRSIDPDPIRQALAHQALSEPPPELEEWLTALATGEIDRLTPAERELVLAYVAADPELGEAVLATQRALEADAQNPLRLTPGNLPGSAPGSDSQTNLGTQPGQVSGGNGTDSSQPGQPSSRARGNPFLLRVTGVGWALAACLTLGFVIMHNLSPAPTTIEDGYTPPDTTFQSDDIGPLVPTVGEQAVPNEVDWLIFAGIAGFATAVLTVPLLWLFQRRGDPGGAG